jgi:hypothetical protein
VWQLSIHFKCLFLIGRSFCSFIKAESLNSFEISPVEQSVIGSEIVEVVFLGSYFRIVRLGLKSVGDPSLN